MSDPKRNYKKGGVLTRTQAIEKLARGAQLAIAGDDGNLLVSIIDIDAHIYVLLSEEMPRDFCWGIL